MNHVFLSGIVESAPRIVSQDHNVLHAVMDLTVTHKTAAGVEKQEQYPISAWRGIAKRMTEMIKPGSRVSVKGYLSQKPTPEGIFLEVTAEEFQVSEHSFVVRPLRRKSIPLRPAVFVGSAKQEPDQGTKYLTETVPEDTLAANNTEAIL